MLTKETVNKYMTDFKQCLKNNFAIGALNFTEYG